MLNNVEARENLAGLARSRARNYETKTINPKLIDESLSQGWVVARKNPKSVRLQRPKQDAVLLEDRVWSLLYKMEFNQLSNAGGASLLVTPREPDGPRTQIDAVAIDNEVSIAVECKYSEKIARRAQFPEELGKLALIRDRFTASVRNQFPHDHKRQTVLAFFVQNIVLSDNDRKRAKDANVALFDERDLGYYEHLVAHIGPAAKYQFLADMLPGKTIPGLVIRIPAIKAKMGGFNCYTFSISPEYLLKVSYVSHRSKGKESDVNTYQRMLKKSRLNQIRQYISDDGIFPTNIVVNLDKNRLQFDRIHQEGIGDQENGVSGWLSIRPAYKSAWIIDGQHRLFAYSGHERAAKSRLAVIAFEGLEPSEQARLFIDINAKQKSVPRSLLQELYAELHWDSDDDSIRVRAIVSKAIQALDADPESALCGRIQTADSGKDMTRCISFTSVYSAVERAGFHIAKEKNGHIIEYGPLWAGDNESTLRRTKYVVDRWLRAVSTGADVWWQKGAGPGGGLAMNDGITTCLNVLKSVFQHFEHLKLNHLDDEDLFDAVRKYGAVLGTYLGSLNEQERKAFRDLRGVQGQTRRTRQCQQAIRAELPDFNPVGLDAFIQQEKAQTNLRAKEIIDRLEQKLQKFILEELRRECGDDESGWWLVGVPKPVRLKVTARYEEEDGKRGGKEYYFDLIDYERIALANWNLFESVLAYGKTGNKEKRLSWLSWINERRKIVSHSSSAVTLPIEDLTQLETYENWLDTQLTKPEIDEDESSERAGAVA